MALDLTELFTALGRVGRTAYLIASGQDPQDVPFTALAGYAYVNPAWLAPLTQSYDSLIRNQSTGMATWIQFAQTFLLQTVAADNPYYGTSLPLALQYLFQEMISQSKTVQECTVGATVAADAANVGTGTCAVTLVRGDGLTLQNTIAEESTLIFTADSYTGGATAGREPWVWTGAPNLSSLGTGTPVGPWDWDWPQGSGAGTSGNAVSAAQDAGTGVSQNYLTNGDFETWDTAGTPFLDYWHLETGTWGTSIQRSGATDGIDGGYCVQFNAGATLNGLEQEFDSSESDGADANAGTTAALANYTGYMGCLWLKGSGVISGGVMTISLVDSAGTVVNDQAGTANTKTITLSSVTTSWAAHTWAFRTPIEPPADGIYRLRIKITTALAGANLLMDYACWTLPSNCYAGGPNVAVFSNPESPFEASADPDAFTLTFTNDRGGASYGATWQTLINRLFQTPGLILSYSGAPNIADSLITSA